VLQAQAQALQAQAPQPAQRALLRALRSSRQSLPWLR
jgi:hypothetical protein